MNTHYEDDRDYCYGCRRMMRTVDETGLCRPCRTNDEGDPGIKPAPRSSPPTPNDEKGPER